MMYNIHPIWLSRSNPKFIFCSKQVENIISKADNNNESECGCRVNMELDSASEEIIYREYIICLKKHQLAIE